MKEAPKSSEPKRLATGSPQRAGSPKNPFIWGPKALSPNLLLTPLGSNPPLTETELKKCKKCAGATNPGNGPALAAAAPKAAKPVQTQTLRPQRCGHKHPSSPATVVKGKASPLEPSRSATSGALNLFDWS